MWRRHGDIAYTLLVFVVFCLELVALAVLSLTFVGRLFRLLPYAHALAVLIGVLALTTISLSALTGYILVYHALTRSREQARAQRVKAWTDRWIAAIYGHVALPPPTPEATEAGLNLRHLLSGDEGKSLAEGLWRNGAVSSLLRKLESNRATDRMEALDGLAKARVPAALTPIIRKMTGSDPVTGLMAARAAARTMSEWMGEGRAEAFAAFARSLGRSDLPAGAMTETLLLMEGNAAGAVARLLSDQDAPPRVLRATLDAVGRLRLVEFAYEAGVWVGHPDPEVRAAALRALGRLHRVPVRARDAVIIALADDTEFVRVQAARAAAFVPASIAVTALYGSMGDRSWWVRRAAAESLLQRGRWGIATLKKAARSHGDRFARDMAGQVLLEGGIVAVDEVPHLKATA
jgi:HEAT repeat protein